MQNMQTDKSGTKVPDEILAILGRCRIEGNTLYLPDVQLERPVYLAVNKVLENIGGKWNRKAKGHIFEDDPSELLNNVLITGETVDLKKTYQFFPTPRHVAEQMCSMAELDENSIVLEPSCGKGDLADMVYAAGVKALVGVELNPDLSRILREKPYLVMMETDFLEFAADPNNGGKWTRIIMNPPFTRQQDIDHILAAYNLLAPGGILVSVVSESPFFWENKKASEFRAMLEQNSAEVVKLDEGAFKESGTMVRARIIKMRKADAPAIASDQRNCKTGWNPYGDSFGSCMAAACSEPHTCCAACPKGCNSRCWYATEHTEKAEASQEKAEGTSAPTAGIHPGGIANISVDKIFPHPDNPRKDLGDLTELANSIKANGIMQNLTVVPRRDKSTGEWDGETYTVIIGHRRLAASKLAGCSEVPCSVTEMTEAEQIRTMLTENMQRNNLTIYEQAQGFQMMLDMGGTIQSVAGDTGISVTTVRQRVSLMKLNPEKFKASEARGATLSDYLALDKLEDQDLKDRVLDAMGTKNFDSILERTKKQQRRRKKLRKIADALAEFAEERPDANGLFAVRVLYDDQKVEHIKPPADADTVPYFFVVEEYHVTLYRKKSAQDVENESIRAKKEANKKILTARRDEAFDRARTLRTKFVEEFSNARAKAHFGEIVSYLLRTMATTYNQFDRSPLTHLGLISNTSQQTPERADIEAAITKIPERAVFLATYALLGDGIGCKCCDWTGAYQPNQKLAGIYNFLTDMGYELSDEEQALLDGTSDVYYVQDLAEAG